VESDAMSLVDTAATWVVPKPVSCEVVRPATCAELIAPICAAVSDAKAAVLIEPICVLVSALTTLVDSAATSAGLRRDRVVVDRAEACPVVKPPNCAVLRVEMTEPTCVV